ncbi:MAG: outer rane hemolysin activator protein [Herminiimonas sp.]|nr:outer rane hemolysin activator protein [Herminiimonas sp.]
MRRTAFVVAIGARACICLFGWSAVLSALASPALLAQAQAPVSPAAPSAGQAIEQQLRREEERARALKQGGAPRPDMLQPGGAGKPATAIPVETPCFPLHAVKLTGADAIRFHWLADAAEPFLGRCVGAAGLRVIAQALDTTLVEAGYVTSRVTLPQQNLGDGVITFQLHIGRVAEVRATVADAARPAGHAWGTWRNAVPAGRGDMLNLRDLEQGIEQMRRLPSQNVVLELEPGPTADTSVIRLMRQPASLRERLRGGIALDNSGTDALGSTQLSGHLAFDNPFGLSDIVSLSASTNVERLNADHRSQSLALNYSIPWGYNLFTISRSESRFAQRVQGTTARFLSSGKSRSTELRWNRVMLRTSAARFGLFAAAGTRRANSFLDDVELIVQQRRTSQLETGVNYRQLIGDASIEFELGYRRGMPWRDAQEDLPGAADGGLTLRPAIWGLTAAFDQPLRIGAAPARYLATLRAQHTRDTTLAVDQIAIGCRCTVRGFDGEAVLLAESGYYLRNDLSMPFDLLERVDTLAFIGADFGRVWGPSAVDLIGTRLAGAAVGVRGKHADLQFELAMGTPLYKPAGFQTSRWNLYLSLTYAF